MSFQDFGKNRSASSARPASASISSYGTSTKQKDGLSSISETILQYQRNVGILEKIVHSLTANSRGASSQELNAQYKAQIDVLGQLEDKIRRQLQQPAVASAATQQKTTLDKLQRDFDRVQSRVTVMQSSVERWRAKQKNKCATAASAFPTSAAGGAAAVGADQSQQQMQLQLQQDRLQEEIMREREQEIRNINRGMHQVNEIYKDLAHIVGSQQEQIDTIENQMEESKVNAESGLKQVEQANERYGNGQCVIS